MMMPLVMLLWAWTTVSATVMPMLGRSVMTGLRLLRLPPRRRTRPRVSIGAPP